MSSKTLRSSVEILLSGSKSSFFAEVYAGFSWLCKILDTASSCSGVILSYILKAAVDLCPDHFWMITSGTPASNNVVAPVAMRLWFVKFP